MKIPIYLFAAAALMTGNVLASAQSYQTAAPGIPGAIIYTGAPEGFNPVTASASELEAYGYPQPPNPGDAKAYANWVRAVSTTRVTPTLIPTNRYHRPLQVIGKPAVSENTTILNSGNWSGYAITGSGSPPFVEVVGDWYVPNIGATTKSITGYSSEWVGIDGDCACNDLIQDGTEADFYGGSAHYDAWYEVIPQPETRFTGVSIAPGDLISAYSEKEVLGGKVTGLFFIANLSTNQHESASLTIPAGTSFSGKSAEWIVERTEVNGSFMNPLPFYAFTYMDDAWAFRSGSNNKILYVTSPNQNIRMYQGADQLSTAYEQDSDSMWFQWHKYF